MNLAIDMLAGRGPEPEVAIRVLFAFDPWSQAVLLVAGNKAGDWTGWYKTAIPVAEAAYDTWLTSEHRRREDS